MAFPGIPYRTEPPPRDNEDFVWLEDESYRVPAWWIKPRTQGAPRAVVVYCHGNAMAISQIYDMMRLWADTLNVVMVVPEIPGAQYDWGRFAFKPKRSSWSWSSCAAPQVVDEGLVESTRPASEQGYYDAVAIAIAHARKVYDLPLVVWGQSLGSGAACEMGVNHAPDAVVLQSPLMSAVRVAFLNWPTLYGVDIFVNVNKVPRFECPVLIMHGDVDEVIHVEHGRRLSGMAKQCEYREIVGAGHNDMEHVAFKDMVALVGQLITRVCEARASKPDDVVVLEDCVD